MTLEVEEQIYLTEISSTIKSNRRFMSSIEIN